VETKPVQQAILLWFFQVRLLLVRLFAWRKF
jgi:hypothetical protein